MVLCFLFHKGFTDESTSHNKYAEGFKYSRWSRPRSGRKLVNIWMIQVTSLNDLILNGNYVYPETHKKSYHSNNLKL